ncbi:Phospholipid scramblase 3 [Holothuria leucospilota]|uniref:Phospholipid scramblase n=1 Tax=Holothuria leucospilota TaxID=206669 RepID=A0A9Q1CPX6_HOLLE|nr:Phospholipid scramblase 3 [Holothuria leucospilota]
MHVVDSLNQGVIRIVRPFQCGVGCCRCAECNEWNAWTISVESPPGNVIGQVQVQCSKWKAHYDILDASSHPVLKVRGPY